MPDYDELSQFIVNDSDDLAKSDHELVCLICAEVICDVEPGDMLNILASTAMDHTKTCTYEQHHPQATH